MKDSKKWASDRMRAIDAFVCLRNYCADKSERDCDEGSCVLYDFCGCDIPSRLPPCDWELHPEPKPPKDKAGSEHDAVEHPEHYTFGRYECIDVMADIYGEKAVMNYAKCNAFKYIWRADHKNGVEDLEKAVFYLNWIIEHGKAKRLGA